MVPGFPERLERLVELGRSRRGRRAVHSRIEQMQTRKELFDRCLRPVDAIAMADQVAEYEWGDDQQGGDSRRSKRSGQVTHGEVLGSGPALWRCAALLGL